MTVMSQRRRNGDRKAWRYARIIRQKPGLFTLREENDIKSKIGVTEITY